MAGGSLARRYARAMLNIGLEQKNVEVIGREVAALAGAMASSPELAAAMANPAFPRSDREKVLVAVLGRLGASQTTVNFTRLLLDRERLTALSDIARELAVLIDEEAGRARAVVTSARPLSSAQLSRLVKALASLSGKKILAETREDPDLLGGVIAQVGDQVYDGSLRTQLRQLRGAMTA
jgi:F-type H+-transporting ATPase subunit delta